MTEFVRVKLENGSKASVPVAVAQTSDGITVLEDEAAVDVYGRPLDVEFPDPAEDAPEGYDALTKDQLRELIDERNTGRDESALIAVDSRAKHADMVAALHADDANLNPGA